MKKIFLAIAFLVTTLNAHSALIFNYESSCDTSCSDIGLSATDKIVASFLVDLDALPTSMAETDLANKLLSFSVTAGSIFLDSSLTSNFRLKFSTDALGQISTFQFLATLSPESSSDTSLWDDTIDLRLGNWYATEVGQCGDIGNYRACADSGRFISITPLAFVTNTNTSLVVERVSEPATFGLIGMLLLTMLRRKVTY